MNAQTAQSRPAESYESLSFFPSLYRVEYEIRRPGPSETGLRGPRLQQGQRGDGFSSELYRDGMERGA